MTREPYPFVMGIGLIAVSIPMAFLTVENVSLVVPAIGLMVAGLGSVGLGAVAVNRAEVEQPQVPPPYHIPRHTPQYVTVWRQAYDQAIADRVIDLEPVAVRPELPAA